MKFKTTNDKLAFLIEIGQSLETEDITHEMLNLLEEKREPVLEAITRKDYHIGSSIIIESLSGKKVRHNTAISNFITATNLDSMSSLEELNFMKALSSLNTHLLIEMEYYHHLYQAVSLDNLYERFYALNQKVSDSFVKNTHISLTEVDLELLISLVETSSIISSFAKKTGKSTKSIDAMWKEIEDQLIKSGKTTKDDSFYPILVSILKKKLKLI